MNAPMPARCQRSFAKFTLKRILKIRKKEEPLFRTVSHFDNIEIESWKELASSFGRPNMRERRIVASFAGLPTLSDNHKAHEQWTALSQLRCKTATEKHGDFPELDRREKLTCLFGESWM